MDFRYKICALALLLLPLLGYGAPNSAGLFLRPVTRPYLYQIRKGDKISYLFGSYHLGISIDQLPKWLLRLHQKVDLNGYELTNALDQDTYNAAQKLSSEPAQAIHELGWIGITRFTEEQVVELVSLGIPEIAVRTLGVEGLNLNKCQLFIYRKFYFSQLYHSIDHELMLLSRQNNKAVMALNVESMVVQTPAVPLMDRPCDVRLFLDSSVAAVIDRINDTELGDYFRGDEPDDFQASASIKTRNVMWINPLIDAIQANRSFFSVGLSHLFGDDGLLKMLRDRGFTVRRVIKEPKWISKLP